MKQKNEANRSHKYWYWMNEWIAEGDRSRRGNSKKNLNFKFHAMGDGRCQPWWWWWAETDIQSHCGTLAGDVKYKR